jgi:hypothetical protein
MVPIECVPSAPVISADAIYELLSRLAARERSIRPIVLAKDEYRLLLACPQVLACSTAEDIPARAKAANYVLLTAISELVPADQQIAEVVFCVGQFGARMLQQRIDETGGRLSFDQYKKNRKRVLTDVVGFLLRDAPPHNSITESFPSSARPELRWATAEGVAAASAELQYAALLPLFSTYLHHALPDDAYIVSTRSWDGFMAASFDAFCQFLHAGMIAGLTKELPPATARRIVELTECAVRLAPYDYKTEGNEFPLGLLEYYGAQISVHGRAARYTHINVLYEKGWRPWLETQLFGLDVMGEVSQRLTPGVMPRLAGTPETVVAFEALKNSPLAALAVIGHQVERLISVGLTYKYPVIVNARARAYRALSYYYDVDTNALLSNGLSLRDFADRFFEQEPVRLAEASTHMV